MLKKYPSWSSLQKTAGEYPELSQEWKYLDCFQQVFILLIKKLKKTTLVKEILNV